MEYLDSLVTWHSVIIKEWLETVSSIELRESSFNMARGGDEDIETWSLKF